MKPHDRASNGRTRIVELPGRTADAIERRLDGTEFESVDEYVAFALDQLLRELERSPDDAADDAPGGGSDDRDTRDGATDEAVADRLESLGYL